MKVLQINDYIESRGGVEVYLEQLQRLLPRYNVDSFWLGIQKSERANYKIEIFQNQSVIKGSFDSIIAYLDNFIEEKHIDVINVHKCFDTAFIDYFTKKLPVIKSVHNPELICPGTEKFLRISEVPCEKKFGLHCFKDIYTEHCANRHPKRVIASWKYINHAIDKAQYKFGIILVMSNYMKDILVQGGILDSKIIVNPYFTESNECNYDLSENRINLLFIGRLTNSKGPHFAIEAVKDILLQSENVFLEIIGDGEMRGLLENKCKEFGISSKVIFHGWKNKDFINIRLKSCYLAIFSSIYPEAFGIVGIEAMMAGKPVVAFDVGGVSTWLNDAVTGYLLPSKGYREMGEKITLLLNDLNLYQLLCRNAKIEAMKNFNSDRHINTLIEEYKKAIQVNKKKS